MHGLFDVIWAPGTIKMSIHERECELAHIDRMVSYLEARGADLKGQHGTVFTPRYWRARVEALSNPTGTPDRVLKLASQLLERLRKLDEAIVNSRL
ncbi:hypothetical protein C9I57_26660 [Trinickia symbiotica]|uniref:Uncharacterized protein n=1 Tax=Trinickia symbiotica TaxID=863227 RepID=A0A2T3XMQ3_9BURK|nr:hypothetical protein C9I57_26660 [Trinickia symbiotica]